MDLSPDINSAIWRSDKLAQDRAAKAPERERENAAQWRLMAAILPFNGADAFTFLDLGAGTGLAWLLRHGPNALGPPGAATREPAPS